MLFTDPDSLRSVGRVELERFWRKQLAKTELFAEMSEWPLEGQLLARDATSYFAADAFGLSCARVGEASFALDPLSSTGVEKAMQSGHFAAIALHTLIKHPARAELCMRFCRERQRETVVAHALWASEFYARVKRYGNFPFWQIRAAQDGLKTKQSPPITRNANPTITFGTSVRLSGEACAVEEACVVGNEICAETALTHPALSRPVAFLGDFAVWPLLKMVASTQSLESLIGLWSAHIPRQQAYRMAKWLLAHHILEAV
jgi:hypothetical protein